MTDKTANCPPIGRLTAKGRHRTIWEGEWHLPALAATPFAVTLYGTTEGPLPAQQAAAAALLAHLPTLQ